MGRDKDRFSIPPVGATSLLTVFAVLCLTVFALLTLSDVRSDARLADASLRAVQSYYAADAQAQATLARLRAGEVPDGVAVTSLADGGPWDRHCSYTCPVSDTLELQVELDLSSAGGYRIARWQTVSTLSWDGETTIRVWTPD